MDNIPISIIVPAFNAESYIKRCITSILEQTFTSFEVIVIDDGSTDNTFDIVKNLQTADNRIQIYHQSNQGEAIARTNGVRSASGKYIVFCDADDYMPNEALACMIKLINKANVDIVQCASRDIYLNKKHSFSDNGKTGLIDNKTYIQRMLNGTTTFGSHCRIMKRDLFQDYPFGLDHCITNNLDLYLNIGIALNAQKVLISDEVVYCYEVHESSISQHPMKPDLWMKLLLDLKKMLSNNSDFSIYSKAYSCYCARTLLSYVLLSSNPSKYDRKKYLSLIENIHIDSLTKSQKMLLLASQLPCMTYFIKICFKCYKFLKNGK